MAETAVASASAWWGLLVPLGVLALAYAAAVLEAGGAARRALAVPVLESARLLTQPRRSTTTPDRLLWRLGVVGGLVVVVMADVVLPLGTWSLADLDMGVVWWTAFMALLWVTVFVTGWASDAPFALAGGYRFVAQALAYEMPLAIAVITASLAAGSLRVGQVVAAQADRWFVVEMPAAFVVYLVCALAVSFSGPFGTPVARDLAGGVLGELSGVDRLVFQAGRLAALGSAAAFAVPLFLGGGAGPLLPAAVWTVLKTLAVLALLVAVGRRLPLLRGERFTELGWVLLLPLALLQLLATCVLVLRTGAG